MNTYSLEQVSRTGNLDSDLIIRQYKLNLIYKIMGTKSNKPKLTQKEIAKKWVCPIALHLDIEKI